MASAPTTSRRYLRADSEGVHGARVTTPNVHGRLLSRRHSSDRKANCRPSKPCGPSWSLPRKIRVVGDSTFCPVSALSARGFDLHALSVLGCAARQLRLEHGAPESRIISNSRRYSSPPAVIFLLARLVRSIEECREKSAAPYRSSCLHQSQAWVRRSSKRSQGAAPTVKSATDRCSSSNCRTCCGQPAV